MSAPFFRRSLPAVLIGTVLTGAIAFSASGSWRGIDEPAAPKAANEMAAPETAAASTPDRGQWIDHPGMISEGGAQVEKFIPEDGTNTKETDAPDFEAAAAEAATGTEKMDVLRAWDQLLTASRPASLSTPAVSADEDEEDEEAEDEPYPEPRRACIHNYELRGASGFRVIDDYHVALRASPRRWYLITFATRCFRLRFATSIVTVSRFGRICGFAGERVFVGNLGDRQRCFVRSVERVESYEHAVYVVEKRREERRRRREEGRPPKSGPTY